MKKGEYDIFKLFNILYKNTMTERILHIIGRMNVGGAETFIMNVYRNIDRDKVQFDFVIHTKEKCDYEDEILSLGGKIFRIEQLSKHPLKNMFQLRKILKENKSVYRIIHRHTDSSIVFTDLLVAKLVGIKNRYAHSHSNKSVKGNKLHKLFRPLLNILATRKFACSEDASLWTFGKKGAKNTEVLYNGIDFNKFLFKTKIREKIRTRERCNNNIVIGHVGRFEKVKNHRFIVNMFKKLLNKNNNYELWLIGDGTLREEIEQLVISLDLKEKVKFFGLRKDIGDLLQAVDIFVFPSIYEGLGISLIEAQISGLPCIVSNAIQDEAIITDNVIKLEITDKSAEEWVSNILNININDKNRVINIEDEKIKKFNVQEVCNRLEHIYLEDSNKQYQRKKITN